MKITFWFLFEIISSLLEMNIFIIQKNAFEFCDLHDEILLHLNVNDNVHIIEIYD
jgi:hypothetical protein